MKGNYKLEKIENLKVNPKNPRVIKDVKFKALVRSLEDFPKMLEYKPLLVDESNVVLGGNQRLEALKASKLNECFIIQITELSEIERQKIIVIDNMHYGRFDWSEIELEYDKNELLRYGFTQEEIDIVEDGFPEPPQFDEKEAGDVRIMVGEFHFTVERAEWDEFDLELKREVGLVITDIHNELGKRLGFNGFS